MFKRRPEYIEAFQWQGEGTEVPDWARIRKEGNVFLVKLMQGEFVLHEDVWVCREKYTGLPFDRVFLKSVWEMKTKYEPVVDEYGFSVAPSFLMDDEVVGTHDDGVEKTPILDSEVKAKMDEIFPDGAPIPDLAYSIAYVSLKYKNALKLLAEN